MIRNVRAILVGLAATPLLAVGLAAVPATAAEAAPTELLFSEYVEGSSNN